MASRSHLHAPGQRDTRRRYSKVGIFSLSLSSHHLPHHVQDGIYASDLYWWCGIQSSFVFCVQCSVDWAPCQLDKRARLKILCTDQRPLLPRQRTNQTPIIIVFLNTEVNTKVRGLNPTPPVQVGGVNAVLYMVRQVVRSEELELVSVTLTCFLD